MQRRIHTIHSAIFVCRLNNQTNTPTATPNHSTVNRSCTHTCLLIAAQVRYDDVWSLEISIAEWMCKRNTSSRSVLAETTFQKTAKYSTLFPSVNIIRPIGMYVYDQRQERASAEQDTFFLCAHQISSATWSGGKAQTVCVVSDLSHNNSRQWNCGDGYAFDEKTIQSSKFICTGIYMEEGIFY